MTKYKVLTPVLQGGVIVDSGEIELDEKQALRLQELGVVGDEVPEEAKELEDMSAPELKSYAKKNGIDLAGATRKEEVLKVIQDHEANQGNEGGE
jgi:hypothetical protein